jgi:hypothetical protein
MLIVELPVCTVIQPAADGPAAGPSDPFDRFVLHRRRCRRHRVVSSVDSRASR